MPSLPLNSYVVLFGGGNPSEFTIPVYTDDGKIGDGLTDTGEAIHLIDNHGHEVAVHVPRHVARRPVYRPHGTG